MSTFKLDLGLERFEDVDEYEGSIYLSGGIRIVAGDTVLTDFEEFSGDDSFLGTYVDVIWHNIALNASRLVEKDIIEFTVMTEGWDPVFKVEGKEDSLEVSMSEVSAEHPEIDVPEEYFEGIEIGEKKFFSEIIGSGKDLRDFYSQSGKKSPHISDFETLLNDLEELKKKI